MAQMQAAATSQDQSHEDEASRALLQDHEHKPFELQSYPTQPPNYQEAVSAPDTAPIRRPTHRSLAETVQKPRWAPPGTILRSYQQANYCIILQWVMCFFVLGSAANVVDKRGVLPSSLPYSVTALVLGIWFILTLFFRLRYSSASPTTAKPPVSYMVWTGIYLLLWGATMGCGIAIFLIVKPYQDEVDMSITTYSGCRKYAKKPCHPFTAKSMMFVPAAILLSFGCAAFGVGLCQVWNISRLWRNTFTEEEMRTEFEATPKLPKVSFRAAWKEGWRKGRDMELTKQNVASAV